MVDSFSLRRRFRSLSRRLAFRVSMEPSERRSSMKPAARTASAMMVSCGFTPREVGSTLASQMKRFSTSQVSPELLTTELWGSPPMAQVPMGW